MTLTIASGPARTALAAGAPAGRARAAVPRRARPARARLAARRDPLGARAAAPEPRRLGPERDRRRVAGRGGDRGRRVAVDRAPRRPPRHPHAGPLRARRRRRGLAVAHARARAAALRDHDRRGLGRLRRPVHAGVRPDRGGRRPHRPRAGHGLRDDERRLGARRDGGAGRSGGARGRDRRSAPVPARRARPASRRSRCSCAGPRPAARDDGQRGAELGLRRLPSHAPGSVEYPPGLRPPRAIPAMATDAEPQLCSAATRSTWSPTRCARSGETLRARRAPPRPVARGRAAILGFDQEYVTARGSYLYDADGRAYLDFHTGEGFASLGHNHPDVRAVLQATLAADLARRRADPLLGARRHARRGARGAAAGRARRAVLREHRAPRPSTRR